MRGRMSRRIRSGGRCAAYCSSNERESEVDGCAWRLAALGS